LSFSNYQKSLARCWWLTIVILATQEAEIRQIVQSQPRKIVLKTLSKKTHRKKRAGGVAQSEDPGLKPQHCKKKKKKLFMKSQMEMRTLLGIGLEAMCVIFWQHLSTFCPCSDTMCEAEFKGDRLIM
jgi:hypothetical protein